MGSPTDIHSAPENWSVEHHMKLRDIDHEGLSQDAEARSLLYAECIETLKRTRTGQSVANTLFRLQGMTAADLVWFESWSSGGPQDMEVDINASLEACRAACRMVRLAEHDDWTSEVPAARLAAAASLMREAHIDFADTIVYWKTGNRTSSPRMVIDENRVRAAWKEMRATVRPLIFQRDGNRCSECRSKAGLTVDHVVPISAGGQNILSNLRTLCRACNTRKSARYTADEQPLLDGVESPT